MVVTGSKELSSCLVFVVIFCVKGVDILDKVVTGCAFSDSVKVIWGILEILVFGCKVGGCISLERLQEVFHEAFLKFGINTGLKWKQREKLMEECIVGIDIRDEHGHRVSYKGLEMNGDNPCA